ncbi:MAG TPA: DEAD/DEAH box helicase family protein [Candidatus Kapabacteria bacterium]
MQLKEYQEQCLVSLREYLASVREFEVTNPRYAARGAWEEMRFGYSPLKNFSDSRPFICLQVPTGGGKTMLAAHAIDIAQEYLTKRKTGLVLWVVPTQQIYKQTLKSLRTKDHPYRQVLDRSSGGRTLIIEKNERFSPSDVEGNLVILLMMMQSTSRETKDFLRMYRDSEFTQFFPSEERLDLHEKMLERFPMLDTHTDFNLRQIKTSLGNTIRILEPVIILDEGHRARSLNMQETLARFNPRAIIEFTATPHEASNVLVKITGKQLLEEEMVKLPLNVKNIGNGEWIDTLSAAITRLNELKEEAEKYEERTGEFIRPICLIQVERTGKDQREKSFIHSEDVKEELLKRKGVYEHEIAIQSSDKKELNEFEDANGLLTKNNHIRFIITKEALKEGWDCSFAYVLCLLNTPQSRTGATQLIGRILRQPYAKKTGVEALDEAYVISHRQSNVINDIKKGFDEEGLTGLSNQIRLDGSSEGQSSPGLQSSYSVRDEFKKAFKHFILPTFVYVKGGKARPLDYEADILSRLDWSSLQLDAFLKSFRFQDISLGSTIGEVTVNDDDSMTFVSHKGEIINTYNEVTPEYLASEIMNAVPNPWMAYELANNVLLLLRKSIKDEIKLSQNLYHIADSFRTWLYEQKDELARSVFFDLMSKDEIRFVFFTDSLKEEPSKNAQVDAIPLVHLKPPLRGEKMQRSLFDPLGVVEDDFDSKDEKEVALWLDSQAQLFFWYKNAIGKNWYFLQGWKSNKLYPDYISTTRKPDGSYGIDKVFVIESKGMHLSGNPKTKYIEEVFAECNRATPKHFSELGFEMNSKPVKFEVLRLHDWENRLKILFEGE